MMADLRQDQRGFLQRGLGVAALAVADDVEDDAGHERGAADPGDGDRLAVELAAGADGDPGADADDSERADDDARGAQPAAGLRRLGAPPLHLGVLLLLLLLGARARGGLFLLFRLGLARLALALLGLEQS